MSSLRAFCRKTDNSRIASDHHLRTAAFPWVAWCADTSDTAGLALVNTTRVSLVLRIRDAEDSDAWSQFVDIYGPLIYRYGCRKGLQDADAADLTQDVLREVSNSIGRFDYDPSIGRFRNWLFAIARHTLSHLYRNGQRQPLGSGDTRVMASLETISDGEEENDLWEAEYRRHLFQWASAMVRSEFHEHTWQAFWLTAVDGLKPVEVAAALDMSVGSVYVAKNRVTTRLRKKIEDVDDSIED